MIMRCIAIAIALIGIQVPARAQTAMPSDQVPATVMLSAKPQTMHLRFGADGGVLGSRSTSSALGVDSLANWSSYFYEPGLDPNGFGPLFSWTYTMVGRSPFGAAGNGDGASEDGATTMIRAPIVPVNIDLRNADGSPRYVNGQRLFLAAGPYVKPLLASPIFQPAVYDSSVTPTQYTDAVQRAEFYNYAPADWHTLLDPVVRTTRTMTFNQGTYRFALNKDGTCCAFVLIDINIFAAALFPATPTDVTSPVGAAENAGDIRTRDMSTFLFPNTFLYFPPDPKNCCVIGFHTYDIEPGSAANGWREKRYVLNYSSWVSPGVFSDPSFGDITPVSHELSETFNDPFGNNVTPWWLSPNGNCQDNLEVGDVVEGLPNATYPITLNGVTYHPQNEALLQWFASVTPSTAIGGAYSYPDKSVLTSPNVSQTYGCGGPY